MSSASWAWWGQTALALALAWPGESYVVRQQVGPASLSIHPDDVQIDLSGVVRLRLTVTGSTDLEVQSFTSTLLEPSWRLIARNAPVSDLGRSRLWVQEIHAEPLRPGDLTLELPSLRYRDGDGSWQIVDWKPIQVKVRTAALADVKDLRDITSIEKLPQASDGNDWSAWIAAAGGAIALLVLIIVAWRRRKNRSIAATTPEDRARRELERIVALKLAESGNGARFHVLLHDVVRRYLRRRFQVAARARTSAELRAQMDASAMTSESRRKLDAFLEHCDRAKFAGDSITVAMCQETAEIARQIIDSGSRKSVSQAREIDSPASAADRERDGS